MWLTLIFADSVFILSSFFGGFEKGGGFDFAARCDIDVVNNPLGEIFASHISVDLLAALTEARCKFSDSRVFGYVIF